MIDTPKVEPITPAEFRDWRDNPTTRKVMDLLAAYRHVIAQQLVDGEHTRLSSTDETAMRHTQILSCCQVIDDLTEPKFLVIEGLFKLIGQPLPEPKEEGKAND